MQSHPAQRRFVAVVAPLLMVAIACSSFRPSLWNGEMRERGEGLALGMEYNRTVIAGNYFEDGFIRRGLGGTIARLIGDPSRLDTAVLFHLFSATFVAVPLTLLLARLVRRFGLRDVLPFVAVAIGSPQLVWAWSRDIARTDMLICGLIAWATIAMLGRRPLAAIILLLTGFFVHETSIVVGAPVLAALALDQHRRGRLSRAEVVRSAALLICLTALTLVANLLAPSSQELVASIFARVPPSHTRDVALYVMVTDIHGVLTSICWNLQLNRHYWPVIGFCLLILALYAPILGLRGNRDRLLMALAALLPFAFLATVATDLGRWLTFAIFNGWLLAVSLQIDRDEAWFAGRVRASWISLALLGFLMVQGPASYDYPNAPVRKLFRRIGLGRQPDWQDWLKYCDPNWRAEIGVSAPPVR